MIVAYSACGDVLVPRLLTMGAPHPEKLKAVETKMARLEDDFRAASSTAKE